MKPEAQRIAIAEACGWKLQGQYEGRCVTVKPGGERLGLCNNKSIAVSLLPDYCNDLNAMHEAEKRIVDHTGYWQQVEWVIGGPPLKFSLLHATAAQRAQAFLRTIGKWTDS